MAGHPDPAVRYDLLTLAEARVFFGHQSVGQNVIDGLKDLSVINNVTQLRWLPPEKATETSEGFFADAYVGENHKPHLKCDAFKAVLDSGLGDRVQVAFLKFCYSDIVGETDVDSVFAYYRAAIDSVKSHHPRLQVVHVTVPLIVGSKGWKRALNRILGRLGNSDSGNMKRAQYNDLLRSTYKTGEIFDLARIQSTDPDGKPVGFRSGQTIWPELYAGYASEDGSHLNAGGGRITARELARTIAWALHPKRQ